MGEAGHDDDQMQQQVDDEQLQDEQADDQPAGDEQQDQPQGDQQQDGQGGDEGEDEDVVQIGDEEPPASEDKQAAPEWVRELRERQRKLARENAELRAKLGAGQPTQTTQKPVLPPKPKLADHDYDEEKHAAAMDEWYGKQREVERWEQDQAAAATRQAEAVRQVQETYQRSKGALKVKDFQDAEDEVVAQFDVVQQSIVMKGAENPGAMVYALGKNPKKLAELASIKDPVKFAVAVGNLQRDIKVTKRPGTKPAPEKTIKPNTSASTSTATLERLQAEADRTGDRTKVAAYLRKQQQAGK